MNDEVTAKSQSGGANKTRRTRQLSSMQVIFAVILAMGLMLAIQFSTRITADRDLQSIQNRVEQEIELLRREQGELVQQLAFVESDAFVEAWARGEGRMVREGEVLVIPVPSNIVAPEQEEAVDVFTPDTIELETTLPEPENWELWWALFFDTAPPQFGS